MAGPHKELIPMTWTMRAFWVFFGAMLFSITFGKAKTVRMGLHGSGTEVRLLPIGRVAIFAIGLYFLIGAVTGVMNWWLLIP